MCEKSAARAAELACKAAGRAARRGLPGVGPRPSALRRVDNGAATEVKPLLGEIKTEIPAKDLAEPGGIWVYTGFGIGAPKRKFRPFIAALRIEVESNLDGPFGTQTAQSFAERPA